MTDASFASWLLTAVPLGTAALGFAVWSKPQFLKLWALTITAACLVLLFALSGQLPAMPAGLLLTALLPISAFLSLLGQPRHQENREAWLTTLVMLGLGLGSLLGPAPANRLFLALILGLTGILLFRYQRGAGAPDWWDLGTLGLGFLSAIIGTLAAVPLSTAALLMSCAILLPLVPLHRGYVGALTGLPGNLPAFLTLLLPILGFHQLLKLLPTLPSSTAWALSGLALAGTLYGTLKALTQSRVRSLLAFAGLSFLSILWWYVATTRTAPPAATIYLSAVCLASSGLFLAWYVLLDRYGKVDLRAISGLAHPMPRLATLLSLLTLAALGMPPFGVFAGFMGLLLHPSLPLTGAVCVVLFAWLIASWYFLELMQRLLFGRHRPDLRYEDLRRSEFASLLLLVLILIALGMAPSSLFHATGS
jgi:NADH-quinone oxidoreductase subunit M